MSKQKAIFITGTTGLVGSYLTKILLDYNYKVYALARNGNNQTAIERVFNVLQFWDKDLLFRKSANLFVFDGDITKDNLGLNRETIDFLKKEVEEIFHCAAIVNYDWELHELRKTNVLGTKNILDFALLCKKGEHFRKVNYLSTAYVCGNYVKNFRENSLDVRQNFNTPYEQSKFEAEKLILEYRDRGLWVDIFRPAIVIGESSTGKIPVLDQHFYQIFRIWNLGIFDYFPGKDYSANIVPVDELSKSLITISSNTSIKNGTYHLFNSRGIFLEEVLNLYKKLLNLDKPKVIPTKAVNTVYFTPSQEIILNKLFYTFNGFAKLNSFDTIKLLKKWKFEFSEIDTKLFYSIFKYLIQIDYIKKITFRSNNICRKIQ